MVILEEINESNWQKAAALRVTEEQKSFLDSPLGIIARGYVYRDCNARVLAILNRESSDRETVVGIAMVKDLDEEPACYDLQQFMIDARFQNQGFGTQAMRQVLAILKAEGKYPCVEVCVKRKNTQALRLFEKIGFCDTGYIDESCPDCVNLRYSF